MKLLQSLRFPAKLLFALILLGSTFAHAQSPESEFSCATPELSFFCVGPDPDFNDYIPQLSDDIKTIKIAFHVMQQSTSNPQNFEEGNANHTAYLMEIFNRINDLYTSGGPYACGGQSLAWLQVDTRIRFELVGIYYHPDPVGFINYDGTYFNTYCETTYGICNVLDVFFMQLPAGSGTTGYGPGTWIGMYGYFNEYLNNVASTWGAGNSLGHEVGHCLGLYHSWQCDQKCRFPDICQGGPTTGCPNGQQVCIGTAFEAGCYGSDQTFCQPYDAPPILGEFDCSTNFMSYARIKNHISPLQMAAMHKSLINNRSSFLKHEFDDSKSITITQANVIWPVGKVIFGNIYIEPGAKLTIKGKVLMPTGSRIVVKRGAKLVVDGGHITTKGPVKVVCNGVEIFERWQGIEVWGNTAVTATPAMLDESYSLALTDPGVVILRNDAIIENAQVGIQTQQNGGYDWLSSKVFHFNGLISATDADFINCRKSVEFLAHLAPINNPSIFTNCKFYQNYLPNAQFGYEGVTQWQVKGIQYTGCTFEKLKLGIGNLNSSMFLGSSTLKNCFQGANVSALSPIFGEQTVIGGSLLSSRNTFDNCIYGTVCNGYNLLQVSQNLYNNCSYGVLVEGTSGFQIAYNLFQNTSANQNVNSAISMTSSGNGFNYAECNVYNSSAIVPKINFGIVALGDNRNFTFRKETFDCSRDVSVIKALLANGTAVSGKISNQGTPNNAVRNLFTGVTPNGSGGFNWAPGHAADIFTPNLGLGGSEEFVYYYPPTATVESRMVPKCPKQGLGLILPLCSNMYNFINSKPFQDGSMTCETRIINGVLDDGPVRYCRTIPCLNTYYYNIRRADSLLQVGNAPQLYLALQNAPNSATTLQSFLAASPYLSNSLLISVASNTSMSVSNKSQILNANTPLQDAVLEASASYLSASLYNQLYSASTTDSPSPRELQESQKKESERYKSGLLAFLCDSLFKAGNYTTVESLLQNDPDRESREALVGLKLQLGQYSAAQTLLNNYPVSTTADQDFRAVQLINLRRITDAAFQLTVQEDTLLHRQAYHYGPQTGYARALLYLLKGELFDRSISIPGATANRESATVRTMPIETPGATFTLLPNPASQEISLVYPNLAPGSDAQATIFDLQGKLVKQLRILAISTTVDISELAPGVYFVKLRTANGLYESAKFFKQ